MNACTNPEILKVIYFAKIIVNIIKIVIPIALIIIGMIDFSKSTITNDEVAQKKNLNLFLKRIFYAALVFITPWIVETLIVFLGNTLGDGATINFTDCLENADKSKIEALENSGACYYCAATNTYSWTTNSRPEASCVSTWSKRADITSSANCKKPD